MFETILHVAAWIGIGLFMWSVSSSLETIAASLKDDQESTPAT
jgi:hypothetical protein